MTQLKDAVVLLTGAGGGFGQVLTHQLLMAGSRLILSDRPEVQLSENYPALQPSLSSSPSRGKRLDEKYSSGEIITCIDSDLSSALGCQQLFEKVQTLEIPIDILINNAGIALLGDMDDIPLDQWEQLMQINLLTPMRLSTLFMSPMRQRRRGHIVNISSMAGWIAMPGLTAYTTSKFGLRGFGEGLRHDGASDQIQVTTVYPFFSRTPILNSPHYGRLSAQNQEIPQIFTTDPVRVIRATLRGVERNQAEVFPDRFAIAGQWLKRMLPWVVTGMIGDRT